MDTKVKDKFDSYPPPIKQFLLNIRSQILFVGQELGLSPISEELKWNEPSYASKIGSPMRLGYNPSRPDTASIYFNCNTELVPVLSELFTDRFLFIGKRELVLNLQEKVPNPELDFCIAAALRYQQVKNLPMLGF